MKVLLILIKRNIKIFFNDKGMFLTSLITPLILLVLYATFLGNVYKDAFMQTFPKDIILPESLINGLVGSQLMSSILAVSCVTVAFCSNFLMVQDKALGNIKDITISPVKTTTLSISYYIASLVSTLLICFVAAGVCLIYISFVGWYLSFIDVVLIFVDIILLALFGTALSSIINYFLSTQGQISAVGTMVSSCYGFLCGAYMPISQFGAGLQTTLSFLPGTYATSLLREHSLRGAMAELSNKGVPQEAINAAKDAVDYNVYFFKTAVPEWCKILILVITIIVLLTVYILINKLKKSKNN